jgi:hypothetical protein
MLGQTLASSGSASALTIVYAECCYSSRDRLSFRVCVVTLLERFVLLNEQKDIVSITIDIGLRGLNSPQMRRLRPEYEQHDCV